MKRANDPYYTAIKKAKESGISPEEVYTSIEVLEQVKICCPQIRSEIFTLIKRLSGTNLYLLYRCVRGLIRKDCEEAFNELTLTDKDHLNIWNYCILETSHLKVNTRVKGDIVNLDPGQAIFSRNVWGKSLNIDPSKVYRTVLMFRDAGLINLITVKGKYSIITMAEKGMR